MKLKKSFYIMDDAVFMAKAFLGKVLVSDIGGQLCSGIITETEAYAGVTDKASHAYNHRLTSRTEPMYREGGCAYVYLIYGMYSLFNIVTAAEGIPHAILIRAIYPYEGISAMLERRNKKQGKDFVDGPGKLTQALGIHYSDTGEDLCGNRIWIEDRGINPPDEKISVGPRINVDYAEEDAALPYRFTFKYNK